MTASTSFQILIMRCLLFTLLLSGSSAFMMAPAAVARPRSVVRAEKEGEAVAKKKGIPLALLIWPLIAVGDDVRARADESIRHRRERESTYRSITARRSTSRKSSRASRSRASRRPRCRTRTRTTSRSKFCSLFFAGLGGFGYDIAPKKCFTC